jgi:ankyrin repeat protein
MVLHSGVSPNELNDDGELPLVLVLTQENAVLQAQFRVASLLIVYKTNVNLSQRDGTYPIHAACAHTHDIQLLNLLLKNKANVDEQNHNKQTPLHLVAAVGSELYLRRLIDAKVSMHIRDSIGGRTPILVAANSSQDRYAVIALLLGAQANPDDEDEFGTVLHNVAVYNRDPHVVRLLLCCRADPGKRGKRGRCAGRTPFDVAGSNEIKKILLNYPGTGPVSVAVDNKGDALEVKVEDKAINTNIPLILPAQLDATKAARSASARTVPEQEERSIAAARALDEFRELEHRRNPENVLKEIYFV